MSLSEMRLPWGSHDSLVLLCIICTMGEGQRGRQSPRGAKTRRGEGVTAAQWVTV